MPAKLERLRWLLRDMVDIYSPSGKEAEISEYLYDYLATAGFDVQLREVTEGRHNVEILPDGPVELAFIGHIDTVPAFDIEQFGYSEDGDQVRGLGSADMKSGCAAMIEAFVSLREGGIPLRRSGLFLVVGEEENGDGTQALLDAHKFPWAIVGEPTDMVPCLSHYGYLELVVHCFGTRRHASMAGREYNAIHGILDMLQQLGSYIEEKLPNAVMNIRDLHSSESGFAVPDRCDVAVDLHLPQNVSPRALAEDLDDSISASLDEGRVTRYEIDFPTLAQGYAIEEVDGVIALLKQVLATHGLSWKPGKFMSHSDANLLHEAACRPVILGPGKLARAHTWDESVSFQQVLLAANIYGDLLHQFEG